MTILHFLGSTAFLVFSWTSAAYAGGIAGGGGPPSTIGLEKLQLILNQPLTPEIILNWDGDLPNPVNIVNLQGDRRTYRVYDGSQKGSYRLIDRREATRSGKKNTP